MFASCGVYCHEIRSAEQAERKAVIAAQTAITQRGVAVLIVPADVAKQQVKPLGLTMHKARPVIRSSDHDLDRIATAID